MISRRKLLVAVMLVLMVAPAGAGEMEVKARIEPPGPYHVGDRLRFVWDVQHDAKLKLDAELAGPLSAALQQGGFEAAGVEATATTTGAEDVAPVPKVEASPATAAPGTLHTVLSAPVTMFTTGVHRVASVSIPYRDAAGNAQKAATPEMVVPVQSVLPAGKSEPRDVKSPVPYPFQLSLPGWAWALLAALAGLIGWLVMRRRPVAAVVAPPPLPPDEEAYRRIDALLAENLHQSGQVKEFCDRLSDILRHYLGRRFGLHSLGDTSYELLAALELQPQLAAEDHAALARFLESCDLAKFAKAHPDDAQLMALVEAARGLVARTRVEAPRMPAEGGAR